MTGRAGRTGEVAKSFADRGVQYCRQDNAGIGPARNKGVELAQGEFLAFLDAGDRWPVEKIERQLKAFDSDPALEMVFRQAVQLQNGPEWEAGVKDNKLPAAGLLSGNGRWNDAHQTRHVRSRWYISGWLEGRRVY
jgi:glycosyltransferase involved in cell wall biosynthesis